MHRIDPAKKHLAAEFMANPIGVRSPELQRVLWVMRGAAVEGKYVLVCHQAVPRMDPWPASAARESRSSS